MYANECHGFRVLLKNQANDKNKLQTVRLDSLLTSCRDCYNFNTPGYMAFSELMKMPTHTSGLKKGSRWSLNWDTASFSQCLPFSVHP